MIINEYKLNKFIIFLFFFAPFISLIIYNFVQIKFIVLLPQLVREFLVVSIVFLYFFHKGFWKKYTYIGIFIIVLFIYIFFNIYFHFDIYIDLDIEKLVKSIANNLRRFFFIFIILIYFLYILKHKYRELYLKIIIRYLYIFWIFGLITYFLPLQFWHFLKLDYYWAEIMNQVAGNGAKYIRPFEQTGKMFTFDTVLLFGFKAKRLISFYLEPTTTSSLAIASLVLSYLLRKKLLFVLTFISGLLTFSKAFYLFTIFLFFYHVIYKVNKKLLKLYSYIVLFTLISILVFFYYLYLINPLLFHFGFFAHLRGLYNYFSYFNFFGYGLGLSGSFSITNNPYEIGIESSFANIISQLGIIGALIIILYFKYIIKNQFNSLVLLLVIFYFFVYLTSNSATGYSGNFLIIFIFAYFIRLKKEGVLRR